jgi:hypothetical protein
MTNRDAGNIVRDFYDAVARKDGAAARRYLHDDLLFAGRFETYRNADAYIAALTPLLAARVGSRSRRSSRTGDPAAIFFDLDTQAPADAKTRVRSGTR